jgi:hypothetical protein
MNMAIINGSTGADTIEGTTGDDTIDSKGGNDLVFGSRGDDDLLGNNGNDFLSGGRGSDDLTGGNGSDVMWGGLDADRFIFRANATANGDVDWLGDFSLDQADTLLFTGDFTFISAVRQKLTDTEFNGFDLGNNVDFGTDIVITVEANGSNRAEIVLLDVWSSSRNDAWVAYLDTFGLDLEVV